MENQTFGTTVATIAYKYVCLAQIDTFNKVLGSKPDIQDFSNVRNGINQLEQMLKKTISELKTSVAKDPEHIDTIYNYYLRGRLFPKEQTLDLYFHFRKDLTEMFALEDNYVYGILSAEEEKILIENLDELKEWIYIYHFSFNKIPYDFPRLVAGLISKSGGCKSVFVPSDYLEMSDQIKGCLIVGIEQDARDRAFCSVLAEEKNLDLKIYPNIEAMKNDLGEDFKFEVIIATEPGTDSEKVDEALLSDYYTNHLAENGLLYAPFRSSYLSQLACKEERSFMHDMIERCAIKSIIQFPTYFWEGANESVSLVCVENCNTYKYDRNGMSVTRNYYARHNGVIMVLERDDIDDTYISVEYVLKLYSDYKSDYVIKWNLSETGIFDPTDSQEVTYDRIDKSGGILLPEYHLSQYLTREEMLGNCAEVAKITSVSSDASVPYVSEEHLSDVATGRPLSVEDLPSAQNAKTVVTGPAVVMHYAGSAVKTAIIDANVDFAIGDNMFAFSPKCDPAYLECVLHHDLTLHVCENKAYPITTEMILAQIIVDRNYDEMVGYTLRTLGENVQALERKAKEEYDNYQKEIHIRRHAMSQVVSALSADWMRIINGLNKSGSLNLSDTLGRLNPITVSDLIRSISEKIDVLSSQTAHLAEVEYEWGDPEPINVADYLAKYSESNRSDRFRYDTDPSNLQRCRSISINATADALNRVFDSIISNALSHGFTDKTRTDYSVRFRCKPDSGKIRIFIDNNGCALPEGYIGREDSLKMYGVSTSLNKDGHSGIGCYDAENIVKHFGGSLSLKSINRDPDGYTVSYILEFPIVK